MTQEVLEKQRQTDKAPPVLEVRNIETFYGAVMALRGVSLEVPKGKIVTILGANGAGKSTLLKTVSGVLDPEKGQVLLNGSEIQGKEPDHIVKLGIAHVPEGREVFPFLNVEENLRMGAFTRSDFEIGADLELVYSYFRCWPNGASSRLPICLADSNKCLRSVAA